MIAGLGCSLWIVFVSIWLPVRVYMNTPRVHGPVMLAFATFVITIGSQLLFMFMLSQLFAQLF